MTSEHFTAAPPGDPRALTFVLRAAECDGGVDTLGWRQSALPQVINLSNEEEKPLLVFVVFTAVPWLTHQSIHHVQ